MVIKRMVSILVCYLVTVAYAEESQSELDLAKLNQEDCVRELMVDANHTMTLGELEERCKTIRGVIEDNEYSAGMRRVMMERRTAWNPFVITPHYKNYLLAYSYVDDPNQSVYEGAGSIERLEKKEAKLQISLKVPLNEHDIFVPGDGFFAAFTLKAFWQVYNKEISAPFRESNYRPEFYYITPLPELFFEADTALAIGIEHESNGRSQLLSRSWNRIFVNYYFSKDDYLISFRPWYRIPEDKKEEPTEASGDDNPDIENFMGHFELEAIWENNQFEYSMLLRNNLQSDNYGAFQLEVSFPLWGRVRGMAQYFNGYGESLIDYDHRIERLGFGILLTEML